MIFTGEFNINFSHCITKDRCVRYVLSGKTQLSKDRIGLCFWYHYNIPKIKFIYYI